MVRWLIVLAVLGFSVMNGWASAGAPELRRQGRLQAFWGLLGKAPDSARVVREAVQRASAWGDAELCRELAKDGAAQFPEQAALIYFELGGAMSRMGHQETAIQSFRRAIELRKGMPVSFAYFALATLHEERGEMDSAWEIYQDLVADGESLPVHLMEAASFAKRHAKADARDWFEMALDKKQKEGLAGSGREPAAEDYQRAVAVAAELNFQEACEALFREGMRERSESGGLLRYEFAEALVRFGRLEEALESFRAAKKDPSGLKVSFAYVGLAKLLEHLGNVEEAGQVFEELVQSKQVLTPHLAEAAGFEARRGRVERALEKYLEAFRRARRESEEVAVGNILSDGMGALPKLKELAAWFRDRTGALPAEDKQRIRRALATMFGNHAWKLLNEGAFADAGVSAEMALVIYEPDVLKWVEGNRAHAYLFQGRFQEAREIHVRHRGEILELQALDWEKAAREDFQVFREKRLVTPEVEREMRKLESLLGIEPIAVPGPENAEDRR